MYTEQLKYVFNCTEITSTRWIELMEGAKKANGSKIKGMIKKQFPELYNGLCLDFPNPYEQNRKRTKTHYIYVYSAIEYFFKII